MCWSEARDRSGHSLRLPAGIADAWKARLRNRPQKTTSETGDTTETIVPRLSYRECLTPIRAFYLDLAYWATEDPQRWSAWVAPSPIGPEEGVTRKAARQTKSRMDARTRQRLPVLPLLVRAIDARRNTALNLVEIASRAEPGEIFTVAGSSFQRQARTDGIWVNDLATARPRH